MGGRGLSDPARLLAEALEGGVVTAELVAHTALVRDVLWHWMTEERIRQFVAIWWLASDPGEVPADTVRSFREHFSALAFGFGGLLEAANELDDATGPMLSTGPI
jgi:hypothetical protein